MHAGGGAARGGERGRGTADPRAARARGPRAGALGRTLAGRAQALAGGGGALQRSGSSSPGRADQSPGCRCEESPDRGTARLPGHRHGGFTRSDPSRRADDSDDPLRSGRDPLLAGLLCCGARRLGAGGARAARLLPEAPVGEEEAEATSRRHAAEAGRRRSADAYLEAHEERQGRRCTRPFQGQAQEVRRGGSGPGDAQAAGETRPGRRAGEGIRFPQGPGSIPGGRLRPVAGSAADEPRDRRAARG